LKKIIILIPVYNDWRSLNLLLKKINFILNKNNLKTDVLIINDNSSAKNNLIKKKLSRIKKITFLNLKINVGSQKSINFGLNYINKKKENSIVTIIDSDGEDDPKEIVKMIKLAEANKNYVITSNRLARKENLIIRFLYKVHLILTFILTGKWISFGNFTTFNSLNIKKILQNGDSCQAHSAAVMKNCQILRIFAKRKKRFFGQSKVSFAGLLFHSLKIITVFRKEVFYRSFIIILFFLLLYHFYKNLVFFIIINIIIIINVVILIQKSIFQNNNENNFKSSIKNINVI
jgi:hypothetical protein